MSERLTHSDAFAGILTNSEIHHFGGAHTDTEVAYFGKPIDKLFEIENMCCDKLGREVISLTRLRELADAEREGRVVVLPKCEDCRFQYKTAYGETCCFENSCVGKNSYNAFGSINDEEYAKTLDERRALAEPKGEPHD